MSPLWRPKKTRRLAAGTVLGTLAMQADARLVLGGTLIAAAPPGVGTPFGPINLFQSYGAGPLAAGFTGAVEYVDPNGIIQSLNNQRARGFRTVHMPTDDPHVTYMTGPRSDPNSHFDINKWKAKIALYDTSPIRAAVNTAYLDGSLPGLSLLDEPPHSDWSGGGFTMDKATCDAMVTYARPIFGNVPLGFACDHQWRTFEHFAVADFIIAQTWTFGTNWAAGPTAYRDGALAVGAADGIAIAFSLNIRGAQTLPGCVHVSTDTECSMNATDIRNWGTVLAPAGSGLFLWNYHPQIWAMADRVQAMADVAVVAAAATPKSWKRAS